MATAPNPNLPYKAMLARDVMRQVLASPPTVEVADIDAEMELTNKTILGTEQLVFDGGSFRVIPVLGPYAAIVPTVRLTWMVEIKDPREEDVFETDYVNSFDAALDRICTAWMQDQLTNIAQNRAEALAMLEVERVQG